MALMMSRTRFLRLPIDEVVSRHQDGSKKRRASAEHFCESRIRPRLILNPQISAQSKGSGLAQQSHLRGLLQRHSRSAAAHFESDAAVWSDRTLIHHAQSLFDGNINWRETSWPDSPNQAPPTCLSQLVTLLNKRTRTVTGRHVYSAGVSANARKAAAKR